MRKITILSSPITRLFTVIIGIALFLTTTYPILWADEEKRPGLPSNGEKPFWKAPDQEKAALRAAERVPFVKAVVDECPLCRQQNLRDQGLSITDMADPYFLLDSPIIRKEEDHFGPVRFMHAKHAVSVKDCAVCHHYRPQDKDAKETTRCSACHQESFMEAHPERIGLKAAYHLGCMGCHQKMNQGPVDCLGCHQKNVPDHKSLVKLKGKPDPREVTAECLRCHKTAGEDMIKTAHFLWEGPSSYTFDHAKEVRHGKSKTAINNFCISIISNEPRCTSCHAGYGWKDETFDFTDMKNVDCLVCHDRTGTYKKIPDGAGMPEKTVDLVAVAQNVGHTTRKTCGECHFNGGGGEAVKHADLSRELLTPDRNCDIHMGGYDFQCTECHQARNHKIAGRSTSSPVVENRVTCEGCHTEAPHYENELLSHHLNTHSKTISCNTCHSPVYAKCKPTKIWWDWSKAGDKNRKAIKDKYGLPDYDVKKGEFLWEESAKPAYAWYSGNVKRVFSGVKLDVHASKINLSEPVGDIRDPNSKITPFKIMKGVQAVDAKNHYLLIPHVFPTDKTDKTAYWKNFDWQKAFIEGMKQAGLDYSGTYQWIETWMYWGVEHEVMPSQSALSCVQCHESLKGELTCNRCHQDTKSHDFKQIALKGTDFSYMAKKGRDVTDLIDTTDYIDFKSLGYKGDPVIHGGRFKKLPILKLNTTN